MAPNANLAQQIPQITRIKRLNQRRPSLAYVRPWRLNNAINNLKWTLVHCTQWGQFFHSAHGQKKSGPSFVTPDDRNNKIFLGFTYFWNKKILMHEKNYYPILKSRMLVFQVFSKWEHFVHDLSCPVSQMHTFISSNSLRTPPPLVLLQWVPQTPP